LLTCVDELLLGVRYNPDRVSPTELTFYARGVCHVTIDTSVGQFFVVGNSPVHCRMFNSIAGLYLQNAGSLPHPTPQS
jgi:hypothetical protein